MAIVKKILKKTDITKRMTIPSKYLQCFPALSGKQTVDFQVRDEGDRIWKFQIYTRSKNKNKYPKPVLTKGWRAFVCSKELGVGDRVVFYLEKGQPGSVTNRIRVEKPIKVFGAILAHKLVQ